MKDREARVVINLLNEKIAYLFRELDKLQHPHPPKCQCNLCDDSGHVLTAFDKQVRYSWFKDDIQLYRSVDKVVFPVRGRGG